MSRHLRLHIPRATYYVAQRGSARQPIFSTPEDYYAFECVLETALRRTATSVDAYCWTPQAIHLLIQIDEISVGRFMQGLTSRYARIVHQRVGASGHFFQQRYHAALVDAEAYLLKLTRYIHHVPLLAGLARNPDTYRYSSHLAYLCRIAVPWLSMRRIRHAFGADDMQQAYLELMSRAPSPQEVDLFERVGTNGVHVIGGADFLAHLPRKARAYRSKVTLDQIIQSVTCALGTEREHLLSTSRKHDLALARALIAWFATERRVCTLSDVARRFRRDPSTLSAAISRYRERRPELFKLNSLHYLVPLGPKEMSAEDREGEPGSRVQREPC